MTRETKIKSLEWLLKRQVRDRQQAHHWAGRCDELEAATRAELAKLRAELGTTGVPGAEAL